MVVHWLKARFLRSLYLSSFSFVGELHSVTKYIPYKIEFSANFNSYFDFGSRFEHRLVCLFMIKTYFVQVVVKLDCDLHDALLNAVSPDLVW